MLLLAVVFAAATAQATTVTFVSPLAGAQVLGPTLIEATTDAKNVDRVEYYVDGVLAGVVRKPPYRLGYDFGTSLAARTIRVVVWSGGYMSMDAKTITTAALTASDQITVDLVEVPLRVRTSRKLTASDLRLRESGVEQQIRDVRAERPAAHFAFVVDRSLSMGGGKLTAALNAIEGELKNLRPGDTASLVLFNHHVDKPVPVNSTNVVPSGGTSLRDAVASIATKNRTYALIITDGGDRNSELSEEAALRKISTTRTIVNAIVLGDSHTRFLDRAAQNTGGSVVEGTKETVARDLRGLIADINSRYVVVYESSATNPGWRTIEIKPRRGGVEIVSARKGYFAE